MIQFIVIMDQNYIEIQNNYVSVFLGFGLKYDNTHLSFDPNSMINNTDGETIKL